MSVPGAFAVAMAEQKRLQRIPTETLATRMVSELQNLCRARLLPRNPGHMWPHPLRRGREIVVRVGSPGDSEPRLRKLGQEMVALIEQTYKDDGLVAAQYLCKGTIDVFVQTRTVPDPKELVALVASVGMAEKACEDCGEPLSDRDIRLFRINSGYVDGHPVDDGFPRVCEDCAEAPEIVRKEVEES